MSLRLLHPRHRVPRSVLRRYAALPLCADWTTADLRRLDRVADDVEHEAGDVVLSQGRAWQEFVVLVAGSASVVDLATGRRTGTLAAGGWTGHEALLAGEPQPASLIAQGYVHALHVQPQAFLGLVHECPSLARSLTGHSHLHRPASSLVRPALRSA